MSFHKKPAFLGVGLGLRPTHFETILQDKPPIDWFEIISDNYFVPDDQPLHYLDRIREHYPMVMHGVSMSIGSTDPLNEAYLASLKSLIKRIEPEWVSDHLCWTGINGEYTHDLLPLPYTEEAVLHCAARIRQVQEILGRQILIENVSSYLCYTHSMMPEWEFLSCVVEAADCLILLDVNNVYVSAFNQGFNPSLYLKNLPKQRIAQVHLAGHTPQEHYILDTHDAPVTQPVWNLYEETLKQFGLVSTMIERDENIPVLSELLEEVSHVRTLMQKFS